MPSGEVGTTTGKGVADSESVPVRAKDLRFSSDRVVLSLIDGRDVSVPLAWFPTLERASETERSDWILLNEGEGFHWEKLDLDLSVYGIVNGFREAIPRPPTFSSLLPAPAEAPESQTIMYYLVWHPHLDPHRATAWWAELPRKLKVEELDLSVRTRESLRRAGVDNLMELMTFHVDRDITRLYQLGETSFSEILQIFHREYRTMPFRISRAESSEHNK